ncbi:MAG: HEAT repeat domain-containing protein [Anaerolineales bacterium]|nr:HEAT repeat domain-containing protein [Anaerolineales bacterium]
MAQLTFQTVLEHLLDSKKDIPRGHLSYYSDLDPKSLRLLMDVWGDVPQHRKLHLLDSLVAAFGEDMLLSFEDLGKALLDDADAEVRARALSLIDESDDPKLIEHLIRIFQTDSDLAPRLKAAALLGDFVLLGELEELDEKHLRQIEDALIAVLRGDEAPALRRVALESFGYSSREEAVAIIESAYEREDPQWVASALTAMERSQDKRWDENVVVKLTDDNDQVRLAATKAAGELFIESAAPILLAILEDEEESDEETMAAIWALSQIGGEDARAYILNMLDNTEDEDAIEFLEDALSNLDMQEMVERFELLSFDDEDEDDDLEDE